MSILIILALFALALTLLYQGHAFWSWVAPIGLGLAAWVFAGVASPILFGLTAGLATALVIFLGVKPLRRAVITSRLMPVLAKILPKMSETERVALEAGTVWWDGDLFSGNPDWRKLLDFRVAPLSAREKEFLDGPVNTVCGMVQDWEVVKSGDLPGEVWDFLKKHRFFGMIIPEEHGGLGFSAQAHSAVVTRLATRSPTLAVTVMVPNSLGPAELLLHYGTSEQKRRYLSRLASGEELPCFALTEPSAGSDAAAIRSSGVVCRGEFEGREVLGMRLDWDKRYTTLAPVATVIGLAFRLRDPDHLLGTVEDLGITCALVPADLPGVEVGPRHDPLGVPFMNGTCLGRGVFVPIDAIIGGAPMAGKGWGMLMQCLAAGRGISLPSMSTGAAQLATRVAGAYATVREQFNLPIGRFEGIEEPLARIGGLTYVMDAARRLTAGSIDAGEKPSVVSAIVKRYLTESMRTVVNDAMDVLAGAGICLGPRNSLGGAYQAAPIGITVEGANILTRTMIIFGQGAIRCHPHAQKELQAVADGDLVSFDRELLGHIGFVAKNTVRALVLGLTDGLASRAPVEGKTARSFQRLSRMSAAFALVADVAMGTLGGSLKRREKLCGRLADALAWMYLASASLKRFQEEGAPEVDAPYARWCCEHALHEVQEALLGFLRNFSPGFLAGLVRLIVFPLGARYAPPSDRLGSQVARGLLEDSEPRRRLTGDLFLPPRTEPGVGMLEDALTKVVRARPAQQKLRDAVKAKRVAAGADLLRRALAEGVLTAEELRLLEDGEKARGEALAVDAFAFAEYAELRS